MVGWAGGVGVGVGFGFGFGFGAAREAEEAALVAAAREVVALAISLSCLPQSSSTWRAANMSLIKDQDQSVHTQARTV